MQPHCMQDFIPDGPSAPSVGKGADSAPAEERDVARERATVQVGESVQHGSTEEEKEQLPEWWAPTPTPTSSHARSPYDKEVVRSCRQA